MQDKKQAVKSVNVTVRLPQELHRELVERARQEMRSLNSQVVYLLQQGISRKD